MVATGTTRGPRAEITCVHMHKRIRHDNPPPGGGVEAMRQLYCAVARDLAESARHDATATRTSAPALGRCKIHGSSGGHAAGCRCLLFTKRLRRVSSDFPVARAWAVALLKAYSESSSAKAA